MFIKLNNIKNTILHSKKEIIILLFITTIGFFLRIHNNFEQGYWADEILTLIISNPLLPHEQTLKNWKELDGSPVLYFYFLKIFFLIFGFTAENGRLFSVIFSTLSIFISFFFFKIKYSNSVSLFGCMLVALNVFLIWQSKETRIPSSVVFFSIANIIYFYYFINQINNLRLLLLCIFNIFLVSYYPFTITIVFSQLLFLILMQKKFLEKLKITYFYLVSLSLYILINYNYLIFWIKKDSGNLGPITYKFFFNYFFSSFFGTYVFGGFFLIIFAIAVLKILKKKIFVNDILIFHLIIIFTIYSFLILYSLFKTGIAVPRYFIFLLPSIIFVILSLLDKKNLKKFMITFFLISTYNVIISLPKSSIPKPPMKDLFDNLPKNESKIIYINDPFFGIFLKNYNKLQMDYKVISETNDLNIYKKIWFICLNNPKSVVGNLVLENEKKCEIKIENFKEIKKFYITDFKIVLFENENQI